MKASVASFINQLDEKSKTAWASILALNMHAIPATNLTTGVGMSILRGSVLLSEAVAAGEQSRLAIYVYKSHNGEHAECRKFM